MQKTRTFRSIKIDNIVNWGRAQLVPGAPLCVPFSGGVDSATCLALAVRTVGPDKVAALHMGHTSLKPEETENAECVADRLGVQLLTVDLSQVGLVYRNTVGKVIRKTTQRIPHEVETTQNSSLVYAAARDITRQSGAMIVGTLDLAECLVGYFPKDTFCGDFLWIGGLFRAEVRQLAATLGIPPLPEAPVVTSACGSIATYVNEFGGQLAVRDEEDLDAKLLELLSTNRGNSSLETLCSSVRHKTKSALFGRSVYYPSRDRETRVTNWVKDCKEN